MKTLTSDTEEMQSLISTCKSNSGATGKILREAHRRLGEQVGKLIFNDVAQSEAEDLTVICMMRSGLCFGEGIADVLNSSLLFLDTANDKRWSTPNEEYSNEFIKEHSEFIKGRTVILSDAVLNTGNTMLNICEILSKYAVNVVVAANVVQRSSVERFSGMDMYAARTSDNRFTGARINVQKGAVGPDTGDRLFKLI